jgi:hypothetical protein
MMEIYALQRKQQEERPLMTKAMRDKEEAEREKKYPKVSS